MDTKRLILYVLLGLVGFSLWNAWQSDHPAQPSVAATTVATSSSAAAIPSGLTAGAVTTPASGSVANNAPIPADRLIKIHTDVLDVAIDTLGGNVVMAKLLDYKKTIGDAEPVQILSDNSDTLSVVESGLVSQQGSSAVSAPTKFTAAQREYTLQPQQKEIKVKMSWKGKGVAVDKIFTFTRASYAMNIAYDVKNTTKQQWLGQFYAQVKHKKLAEKTSAFQYSTFAGVAISSPDKPYTKFSYDKLAKEKLNRDIKGGWLALQQRYFVSALIPLNQDKTYSYFSDANTAEQIYTAGFVDGSVAVPAGATTSVGAKLYVGPELADNLQAVAPKLDLTVDYGWLWIISVALMWIMKNIFRFVGNWGWTIILVTILIKLAFYKLSESSYRSMAHMKDLAPKMQALKERFADDKQKLNQAMMEMYRKEKINPLGGCLPMIVQIPVFIGLYYVLIGAVELRQAPFLFWIHDLSAKDPFYVLPILMGLSMLLQQRLSPTSPDPMQAKMMMLMPIIFTVLFISFPSGLVLYWLVNNLASLLQQWHINRKFAKVSQNKVYRR